MHFHFELFGWVRLDRDLWQHERTLSIFLDSFVIVLLGDFFGMSGVERGIAVHFIFSEEIFLIPATATINSSLAGIHCEVLVKALSTLELKLADNSFFEGSFL